MPDDTATVTEAVTPGVGVSSITAVGFNPVTSQKENRLVGAPNLPGQTATVRLNGGGVSAETLVTFTNFKVNGFLKICKAAIPGPVAAGPFSFNVSGAPNNPYVVNAGACSASIPLPPGPVTVTESPRVGFELENIAVSPSGRLVSLNIPGGSATVNIVAGDVSTETVVTFTNVRAIGELKICKIAGAGIAVDTPFTFTATAAGLTQTLTVPAGPASQGGYCVVDTTTFPVRAPVTIRENPQAGTAVTGIVVSPAGRSGPCSPPAANCVVATVGPGLTEVAFTNNKVVPPGSCLPSSSLSVLVAGTNVVAYVPKGHWDDFGSGSTGVSVVNVEGSLITPAVIPTPNVVNSCASNPVTGETVCTANNSDVYLLNGTTLSSTLTSDGTGTLSFSGGKCTNCGVAMDAINNRALIGLSLSFQGGYQFLDPIPKLKPSYPSPSPTGFLPNISENLLIDPLHNWVLSAAENGTYEIVSVANGTAKPEFFENNVGLLPDSSGEDCTTGIALTAIETVSPTLLYLADLTQATFTAGSPAGKWAAPSQFQTLTESMLTSGGSGIAVAQGTHIGVVAGEFGGNNITAIVLPSGSGTGVPAITDWVTCNLGNGFQNGDDPHTLTAYVSPGGTIAAGHAVAVLANQGATQLAVVDLTDMLDVTKNPRTTGASLGHACAAARGVLAASDVTFIPVK